MAGMDVEITAAGVEHAEGVLAYYAALLAEKLPFIMDNPVPTLEQEIEFIEKHDGKRAVLLLAMAGGQVVGIGGYSLGAHRQRAHTCSLGISVAKPFRRRGIGTRLIAAGEEWCRSKSVRRLELEVLHDNPAVAFYEKLGFEVEGRKREAIGVDDNFRDLLIMAKLLEPVQDARA
jgi:RimJ/RimL family protein N-acetyltransferase